MWRPKAERWPFLLHFSNLIRWRKDLKGEKEFGQSENIMTVETLYSAKFPSTGA